MHYKKAPGLVERRSKIVRNKTGKCTGNKIKNFIILKLPYCQLKDWYNLLWLIVKTQELQNCTDAAQNWNKLIIKAKLISLLSFALQANKKTKLKTKPKSKIYQPSCSRKTKIQHEEMLLGCTANWPNHITTTSTFILWCTQQ